MASTKLRELAHEARPGRGMTQPIALYSASMLASTLAFIFMRLETAILMGFDCLVKLGFIENSQSVQYNVQPDSMNRIVMIEAHSMQSPLFLTTPASGPRHSH